jgi:hypothetical protein
MQKRQGAGVVVVRFTPRHGTGALLATDEITACMLREGGRDVPFSTLTAVGGERAPPRSHVVALGVIEALGPASSRRRQPPSVKVRFLARGVLRHVGQPIAAALTEHRPKGRIRSPGAS